MVVADGPGVVVADGPGVVVADGPGVMVTDGPGVVVSRVVGVEGSVVGFMQLFGRATKPHSNPTNSITPAPPARAAIRTGIVTSKAVFFIAIIFLSLFLSNFCPLEKLKIKKKKRNF